MTNSLLSVTEQKTCNLYTNYLVSMPMFHYTVHILSDLFACLLPSFCWSFLTHALRVVAEDCIKPLIPWTRVYGVTLQMFICVVVKSHFLPNRTNCSCVRPWCLMPARCLRIQDLRGRKLAASAESRTTCAVSTLPVVTNSNQLALYSLSITKRRCFDCSCHSVHIVCGSGLLVCLDS